jgi:nucleoside-diphosphate-sugar epimerase
MRIFIAGATGTLGIPLVRELIARGHEVTGLTRKDANRTVLENLGAAAVVADVLWEPAIVRAVRAARPDSVVHLLTAIPQNGPMRSADMETTNHLRIEGTKNLLRAAIAAGAKRMVAESVIFAYGYGDFGEARLKEDEPLRPAKPLAGTKETVDAARSLESQVIGASDKKEIESVALRFGLLYGPGVPSTEFKLKGLLKRTLPVVRSGDGTKSWIHVKDAVSALAAAVERGRAGEVYNIADDEPVSFREFLLSAAQAIEAPEPRAVPLWFLRFTAPYAAAFLATRLNVSSEKAKRELGWRAQFPDYREGLKDLAADVRRIRNAA